MHHVTKITIYIDLEPFAYCDVVEASYDNHYPRIEIDSILASSSSTSYDPDTILASTLSIIKIN